MHAQFGHEWSFTQLCQRLVGLGAGREPSLRPAGFDPMQPVKPGQSRQRNAKINQQKMENFFHVEPAVKLSPWNLRAMEGEVTNHSLRRLAALIFAVNLQLEKVSFVVRQVQNQLQ